MLMHVKNFRFLILTLGLALSSTGSLFAEQFRVHSCVTLPISAEGQKTSVKAGINDAVLIELPEDRTFIQGIEISFKVPTIVATWHDSVAWSFYQDIKPSPVQGQIDYSGTRGKTGTFGSSLSLNLQVPLSANNSIKKDPYSHYIEQIPSIVNGKIFLRLQLVMKGTDDEIYKAKIEVSGKPIFINKGKLVLKTSRPAGDDAKPFSVFVDGKSTELPEKGLFLSPGMHDISLVSDYYRNEVRTVNIEKAKVSTLNVAFRSTTPLVRIVSPGGTKVTLDNEPLVEIKDPIEVSQGDHVFRFAVGDYEVVKTITALNGHSYTVSVFIDAKIEDEE